MNQQVKQRNHTEDGKGPPRKPRWRNLKGHDSPGSSRYPLHDFIDPISKRRTRNWHKPRQKRKIVAEEGHQNESHSRDMNGFRTSSRDASLPADHFNIEAVSTNPGSMFIRKHEVTGLNCINLTSLTVNNGVPYVFVSKISRLQAPDISKLSIAGSSRPDNCLPADKAQQKPRAITKRTFSNETPVVANSTPKKTPAAVNDKKNRKRSDKNPKPFPNYLSKQEVEKGLEDGTLVQGTVRINPKNNRSAYVRHEDRTILDYFLPTVEDRNRALEGDEVVLKVKPDSEWVDEQKTASVVYILKMVHPRTAIGFLKLMPDKNKRFAMFIPRDCRIPKIRVPPTSWPNDFYKQAERYENVLLMVKIIEWFDTRFALGYVVENVGISGDLKAETKAILLQHGLDVTPYGADVCKYFSLPERIGEEEFLYREDLRQECIFTIDPATARDLDDAVSCKRLENGNYEIGVHISDVAFFLEENELDKVVGRKATTVYLVNNTYHMLPLELCLHCSLLPGIDKLAFSVLWEMNADGEILKKRFARTVVNSCSKLAYQHAQTMIEGDAIDDDFPEIYNGFTVEDLRRTVRTLQTIALKLREKRFLKGALRLDQPKLVFDLNPETGAPVDWKVYEIKDAHRLIEEFMLLANISVAEHINDAFPELAFLRCHEPPVEHLLQDVRKNLSNMGIDIHIESSGELQSSLWDVCTSDNEGQLKSVVLNHLLAKPMKRANYFCAGAHKSSYNHYALSVPLYTHFTSPIRRYADIIVHRLLAASLGYMNNPDWSVENVSKIADNCNTKKYDAKLAGDASIDLFLAHYIEANQPFIQEAVIVDVKDKSFEAIVLKTGSQVRVNSSEFGGNTKWKLLTENEGDDSSSSKSTKKKKLHRAEVIFSESESLPAATVTVEVFKVIKVALKRREKTNKLLAELVRPLPTFVYGRDFTT